MKKILAVFILGIFLITGSLVMQTVQVEISDAASTTKYNYTYIGQRMIAPDTGWLVFVNATSTTGVIVDEQYWHDLDMIHSKCMFEFTVDTGSVTSTEMVIEAAGSGTNYYILRSYTLDATDIANQYANFYTTQSPTTTPMFTMLRGRLVNLQPSATSTTVTIRGRCGG